MSQHLTAARPLIFACLLSCMALSVHAADVYKWTDANGKVHYGDRQHATPSAAEMKIEVPPPPPPPLAASKPERKRVRRAPAETPSAPNALPPSPTTLACESIALDWAQQRNLSPQQNRDYIQKLQRQCPGMAFDCTSYTDDPASNRCRAMAETPGGNLMENRTYKGRPKRSKII
jgi:Domain of unknown function (DUF4124)